MTPRSMRDFRIGVAALSAGSLGTPPVGHLALLRGEDGTRNRPAWPSETPARAPAAERRSTLRPGLLAGLAARVRGLIRRSGPLPLARAA